MGYFIDALKRYADFSGPRLVEPYEVAGHDGIRVKNKNGVAEYD